MTISLWVPRLLAALVLYVSASSAFAVEYGPHDLRRLLVPNAAPATGGRLDIRFLDSVLQDMRRHAINYPPKFDSPRDQQRAQQDATALIGMLGAAFSAGPVPEDMLLRLGMLGAMAHNLDVPQGAAFAQAYHLRLLKLHPEHALGNCQYGTFLAGSGKAAEALPYLHRAKAKGISPAIYGLGITYLALGDKVKALEHLVEYQKTVQNDELLEKLIDGVRSGKVEIRK